MHIDNNLAANSSVDLGDTGRIQMPWPRLENIGLPDDALERRKSAIGGSDANVILSGNADQLLDLWRTKRGECASADLSAKLAVMLGQWTEAFNRQWFEARTGFTVSDAGSAFVSTDEPWRRATVDGLVYATGSVWEAKHTSAFAKPEEVLARYMPQLQHNMAVVGVENATLSVIYGNHRWEVYEVAADWLYQDALVAAERDFWSSVLAGNPPLVVQTPPPPKPEAVREVCLEGHNSWAVAAWDWLQTVEPAKRHANAVTAIKDLVEDDVTRAYGHGVEAKRSKSGAISIRSVRS